MLSTIGNDFMSVEVDSRGAELKSLRDAAGVERLWSGNPAYWSGQAPILFPVVGGLHGDAYTIDGMRYEMAKHGFARVNEFARMESAPGTLRYELRESETSLAQYPFAFALRVCFDLKGSRLAVRYEVENLNKRVMPFQIGAHEAYACPEGVEAYEIEFDQPETLARWGLGGSFINGETTPWVNEARVMPLRDADFEGDAIMFLDVKSTAVTLRSPRHERSVRVDYAGFETLLFWTKPGAPFLCVEPWCGAPDYADGGLELSSRHRIHLLEPGARFVREHGIELLG